MVSFVVGRIDFDWRCFVYVRRNANSWVSFETFPTNSVYLIYLVLFFDCSSIEASDARRRQLASRSMAHNLNEPLFTKLFPVNKTHTHFCFAPYNMNLIGKRY